MIDVAQWFLDDPYPASAVAIGGNLAWKDGREISDTAEYVFEFPKAWLLTFSSRLGSGPEEDFEVFYGKDRKLDSRNWISRTAAHRRPADAEDVTLPMPPDEGRSHVGNWLDCMRSRQAPNAPIQVGLAHAVACCLGREAERTGRRVRYDAAGSPNRGDLARSKLGGVEWRRPDAKDRPHQLHAGDQRDRATDQPPHRAELHPPPPADVARRSGPPVGSAAQHRVGHRRSADRRRLGHRRRRRPLAARPASAQPAPQRRTRRHSRRRAAARDHDDRPGRRGRALHGAGDVCDGRDARTVRRGSGRRHAASCGARIRACCARAWASACPAASTTAADWCSRRTWGGDRCRSRR